MFPASTQGKSHITSLEDTLVIDHRVEAISFPMGQRCILNQCLWILHQQNM